MPDSIIKADNISSLSGGGVGFPDGSISNPSMKFTNDGDTGLYRIGSNDIGVSAGGSKVLEIDPNTFSTFQGGVERFRIASNGQINAVIPGSSTLYNGFLCRAWVNFNGVDSSIRGSGNVLSITRNSTGDYTVNFTTPMPDANYSMVSQGNQSGAIGTFGSSAIPTTTSIRLVSFGTSFQLIDCLHIWVNIFR